MRPPFRSVTRVRRPSTSIGTMTCPPFCAVKSNNRSSTLGKFASFRKSTTLPAPSAYAATYPLVIVTRLLTTTSPPESARRLT